MRVQQPAGRHGAKARERWENLMTDSRDYPRAARPASASSLPVGALTPSESESHPGGLAPQCECRCSWCRDRRYYSAPHFAGPEMLPLEEVSAASKAFHKRLGLGKGCDCYARLPCRCHCPRCHHREPHRVHFHLFRFNWFCPDKAADWARSGSHSHNGACREIP